MSSIKPKSGKCLDCQPADGEKFLMAKRCFVGPHFHYQKHQNAKAAAKVAKPKQAKKAILTTNKTVPQLLLIAQTAFNAFIRARDSKGDHFVCISCNTPKPLSQINAGHYYSAGNHSYLRFNENNVFSQCIKCNCHEHGALITYRENLIKKIGLDEVAKLDQWRNFSHKWDKIQLLAIIQLYRGKLNKAA